MLGVVWTRDGAYATALGLLLAGCGPSPEAGAPADGWPGGSSGKADGQIDRAAFVVAEVESWNADLPEDARAAKFTKMAASPFGFYRGTNHLYWFDIAGDERRALYGDEDTHIFVAGDQHVANFGAFANDDVRVVYDLNDFDEVVIDDYQFDVWRLAASIVLVGRGNGLSDGKIEDPVASFADSYLDALEGFRGGPSEDDFYIDKRVADGRLDEFLTKVEEEESRLGMLDEWTTLADGTRTFDLALDDLAAVDDETVVALSAAFPGYIATLTGGLNPAEGYFAIKSAARRLGAGTGSLGSDRLYVLIDGPSGHTDDDVILDVKAQGAPTGSVFSTAAANSSEMFAHDAERVAIGRQALLNDVDDHVGWLSMGGVNFSVAERNSFKASFDLEKLDSRTRLRKLARQWGALLAASHARSDRDFDDAFVDGSFEAAVADAVGNDDEGFEALVTEIAFAYADQVGADYEAFLGSQSGD